MKDGWSRPWLVLGDGFSRDMEKAARASAVLARELARFDATWEPHDWSDFE